VSSWLGGTLLAESVPVSSGRVTASTTLGVLARLSITVPRFDGRDWRPGPAVDHPLARYGQELDVTVLATSSVTGQVWETRVGRFLITDWEDDDAGNIAVEGEGLLRRVADDKLPAPVQPRAGGTLVSEARRLLPVGMGAAFDPALTDRACPPGMSWSSDRLAALGEIADAWPALLRTDEWGQVSFRAPLPEVPTPVLTLADGERGTLVRAPRSDTRSGAYNRVIVRSSAPDAEDVQAVVDQTTGPMRVDGPYGVVAREWSSPLIRDAGMAQASGRTMLRSSLLPTRTVPVVCASDPRIDLDDPVEVLRDGWVESRRRTLGPVLRTNLATNPSAEAASTAGFTASAVTLSRSTEWAATGVASLQTVSTGANANCYATVGGDGGGLRLGMQAGRTYTVSATVQTPAALTGALHANARRIVFFYRTSAGAYVSAVSAAGPLTGAGRVSLTVAIPAGATEAFIRLMNGSPTAGEIVRWDAVLVEESPDLRPYFDGTTPDTPTLHHAWTGMPHASTSVQRSVSTVSVMERTGQVERTWGWVTGYDLPLTVDDGDMRLDLGISA
jgi:hypothetical protein